VVPGQNAGRAEEQPLGSEGLPSPRRARSAHPVDTYLSGAVCTDRGAGAALVLPACNSEAIQLHLDEITRKVAPGAHAILILDQAGWHGAKELRIANNISPYYRCRRAHPSSQPSEHLAVHASELAVKPHFQIIRRHRRSLLLRLEHTYRPTVEDRSCPSPDATGRASVTHCENWYYLFANRQLPAVGPWLSAALTARTGSGATNASRLPLVGRADFAKPSL
jgi:hypothetical protein